MTTAIILVNISTYFSRLLAWLDTFSNISILDQTKYESDVLMAGRGMSKVAHLCVSVICIDCTKIVKEVWSIQHLHMKVCFLSIVFIL